MPLPKICEDCKEKYQPKSRQTHYCPKCVMLRKLEALRRGNENRKNDKNN